MGYSMDFEKFMLAEYLDFGKLLLQESLNNVRTRLEHHHIREWPG